MIFAGWDDDEIFYTDNDDDDEIFYTDNDFLHGEWLSS